MEREGVFFQEDYVTTQQILILLRSVRISIVVSHISLNKAVIPRLHILMG